MSSQGGHEMVCDWLPFNVGKRISKRFGLFKEKTNPLNVQSMRLYVVLFLICIKNISYNCSQKSLSSHYLKDWKSFAESYHVFLSTCPFVYFPPFVHAQNMENDVLLCIPIRFAELTMKLSLSILLLKSMVLKS